MRGPTTADKNKVISEYMYPNEKAYPIAYDNDWNDLMEVVEKVEDMGYSVEIVNGSCTITKDVAIDPLPSIIIFPAKKINIRCLFKKTKSFWKGRGAWYICGEVVALPPPV